MSNTISLRNLSDTELHESAIRSARRDREAELDTIEHLREVQRRRLYAKRGFPSLFSYVVTALGFSEPAASQRIQAARLTEGVPEAKARLESGELSFSGAAEVQKFIIKEEKVRERPLSSEEKETIVSKVAGKSFRETGRVLLSLSAHPEVHLNRERERQVTPERTELKFVVGPEALALLERVRELKGGSSLEEVFKAALESYLEKVDPLRKKAREIKSPKASESTAKASESAASHSRYVPAGIRRELHGRSGGRCEFVDSQSGRRCGSRHRLEMDHLVPFALGGATTLENLAHHCRAHNSLRAIETFGVEKMGKFMRAG